MYNSDDEQDNNVDENENDFEQHFQVKGPKKPLPNLSSCEAISRKCWDLHHEILEEKKKDVSVQMIELLNQFCGFVANNDQLERKRRDEDQGEDSARDWGGKMRKFQMGSSQSKGKKQPRGKSLKHEMVQRQEKEQKKQIQKLNLKTTKLVIPLCIRKSQAEYLQQFVEQFIDRLDMFSEKQQDDLEQTSKRNRKRQQFKIIKGARKINVFHNYELTQVIRIALNIHQKIKDIHLSEKDISIFVSCMATNLSPQNMYILEEGLPDSSCIVILPTFSSFEDVLYTRFSKIQIIPVRLFEHKLLFCQFMYNCICDPEIKAYLPKESLKLIDDFDDFPITYRQGSRRLIHCIQRLQILRQRKKKPFNHIEIKQFFKAIQKALKKVFSFFHENQIVIRKYIKSILDQKETINILNKYLNKNSYFRREEVGETELELVVKLRDSLIHYFQKEQSIKQYAAFLKDAKVNPIKKSKIKDKDLKRLQVNPINNLDEKALLEYQLRQAITSLTDQIRSQANTFKWHQFFFLDQIKPMLPYNIFNSVKQSPVHQELLEFIYSSLCTPMSKIIYAFCAEGKMKEGELMYYMKDLEMYGLVDISESTLKPMVTPGFFDKASYKTRKQG